MKKFLITEDERRHILGLYGLIKEDIDPEVGGTLSVKTNYKSGFYTMSSKANLNNKETGKEIVNQLGPVIEFIRKNPDSIVDILLIAQESAIPNYDMEKVKKQDWLEEGVLSQWRQEYLNEFFQNYFNNLKQTGYISKSVLTPPVRLEFKKPATPFEGTFCPKGASLQTQRTTCMKKWGQLSQAAEGTPQKKEYDELRKKYNDEQNSELLITVKRNQKVITSPVPSPTPTLTPTPAPPDCATNLKIQVSVKNHRCQNAEFFIFANQTLLLNSKGGNTANLNNADTSLSVPTSKGTKLSKKMLNPGYGKLLNGDDTTSYDGKGDIGKYRSDTFIVTEEQSKSIIKDGEGFITIWMIATTRTAHRDIPDVVITKNGKQVYKGRPKAVKSKLLTLDACGDKQYTGTLPSEPKIPVYDRYVTQLVSTRNSDSKQDEKKGDSGEEDQKQVLLERTNDLVQTMKVLLEYVTKTPSKNFGTPEFGAELEKNYNFFINKLNEQPLMTKDEKGDYVNKEIRKHDLYGDVRMDLKIFYSGFDALYLGVQPKKSNKEVCTNIPMYNSKGALNCNGKVTQKIQANAKSVLNYSFTTI